VTSAPRPATVSHVPDEPHLSADPGAQRTILSARNGSDLALAITDLAARWQHRALLTGHCAATAEDLRSGPYVALTEDVATRELFDRVRREHWGLLAKPLTQWNCLSAVPAALRAALLRSRRLPLAHEAFLGMFELDDPSELPPHTFGVCVVSAWAVPLDHQPARSAVVAGQNR